MKAKLRNTKKKNTRERYRDRARSRLRESSFRTLGPLAVKRRSLKVKLVTLYVAATALAFAGSAAHAAKIEVDHDKCDNAKCARIILVSGEIARGDADAFKSLIKSEKIERAVVMLHSPGGTLNDAITIGAIIHESGFVTLVGDNGTCASACADIWLAGKVRYASEEAAIGFHRASLRDKKTGKYLGPSKTGDDMLNAYYRRLGLTEAAIHYLLSANPHDITWLKGDKADEIGIIATSIKPEEKKQEEAAAEKSVKTQQCTKTTEFDLLSKDGLGEQSVVRNKCL
jgi:hypothetical protein